MKSKKEEQLLTLSENLNIKEFDYTIFEQNALDEKSIELSNVSVNKVYASVVEYEFGIDKVRYLKWKCPTNVINELYIGENQFIAKSIVWKYDRIAWTAGYGWPLYETPCPPKGGRVTHKITAAFGGKIFQPCSTPASGNGVHKTSVKFYVHDDKYDDNTGFFELIVTSYSDE